MFNSQNNFLQTIVPKLKHSLSLTLKHYLTVAANLLYPSDTDKSQPFIRYVSGDSVPLTIAISARDFDELTESHPRDSDQFYDFMPEMPPLMDEGEYKLVPLISLHATLFPGRGIGVSNDHCIGDARSIVGFMWAWAEINKFNGDEEFLSRNGESMPFFDRLVFGECARFNDLFWDSVKRIPLKQSSFPLPTKLVRSSFTLNQSDIEKLKNRILSADRGLVHVSSFVVPAAYIWSCVAKSADAVGEEVGGDEAEVFFIPADGRGRPNALVDPPVPENYFGNFLGGVMLKIEHGKLAADDGFVAAAAAMSEHIKNQVNDKENFLNDCDKWLSRLSSFANARTFGVSGSPKFDLSNADFGWGKAKSFKVLSLDGEKYSMSLCNSQADGGGLVAGLSLRMDRMKALEAIFMDGLKQ